MAGPASTARTCTSFVAPPFAAGRVLPVPVVVERPAPESTAEARLVKPCRRATGWRCAAHARAKTVTWWHGHAVGAATWWDGHVMAWSGGGAGGDRPGGHLGPGRAVAGVR